jgi:uncharacterized integral membrane protein (TIGR00698 family)
MKTSSEHSPAPQHPAHFGHKPRNPVLRGLFNVLAALERLIETGELEPHNPALRGLLNGLLFVALFTFAVTRVAALPVIVKLGLSPLIVGIVAGGFYGNTLHGGMPGRWENGINFAARRLLRIAVAFFGLRVSVQEIVQVGLPGLAQSLLVVVSTLAFGTWVGMKLLRLDRDTALLTAAGGAICGAAAVIAVESTLKAKPYQSAMAVGCVVLFGTLAMFLYPLAWHAGLIPLDAQGLGLYFGGTIHEIAQVVGAASDVSAQVTHTAVIVKMTRVILLVPVLLALGIWLARTSRQSWEKKGHGQAAHEGHEDHAALGQPHQPHAPRIQVPWFAIGFLALVGVHSLHLLSVNITQMLNTLDTFALTMAMTALGIQTRAAQIRAAGPRALAAGALIFLWLVLGGYGITVLVQHVVV